eukprot:303662-Amphidinium_carterae.1
MFASHFSSLSFHDASLMLHELRYTQVSTRCNVQGKWPCSAIAETVRPPSKVSIQEQRHNGGLIPVQIDFELRYPKTQSNDYVEDFPKLLLTTEQHPDQKRGLVLVASSARIATQDVPGGKGLQLRTLTKETTLKHRRWKTKTWYLYCNARMLYRRSWDKLQICVHQPLLPIDEDDRLLAQRKKG